MAPKKCFCGCCQKWLGKGPKQNPTVWCPVCSWVHFTCSGLENKTEYNDNFLGSKSSRSQVMTEDDDQFSVAHTKIHDAYTNPEKSTVFGSPINLARATNCSIKHVNRYLNSSETYTKFKPTWKPFPTLKVISYRLNEVWFIDLSDTQQLSRENLELGIYLWRWPPCVVNFGSWAWIQRRLKHVQKRTKK